jgi:hypothetical protein
MRIQRGEIGTIVHADQGDRLADCPVGDVVELLRESGFILFRGLPPALEAYEAFTAQFGDCGDTREVHYPHDGTGLGFHAEDAYNPYRPDAIWFYCAYEGSDGGIPTGVVDGVGLLERLPEPWQTFARWALLRFDRQWSAEIWQEALEVPGADALITALRAVPGIEARLLADDTLHVAYETPMVVRTPGGRMSFSNTLLQAATDPEFYGMRLGDGTAVPHELLALSADLAAEAEVDVGWATGDVVVIDNCRMMHRRRGYVQTDRDLRARHGENLFGSTLPVANTPLTAWVKRLVQGDIALPTRVGRPRPVREEVV